MIVATSLVVLTLFVGVSHAATEKYSANLRTLEIFFGDGKHTAKLYTGKRQPDAGLAQILVLSGLSITAVDGRSVKSKRNYLGYRAYKQLPGTFEFEVTSWKSGKPGGPSGRRLSINGKSEEHANYTLKAVLEAGQKYVLSPIWNDGEMGIIAPSQVCLQGPSDNAHYCALRPRESDDAFTMDEKHGVIVVGLTRSIWTQIILINLDCDWKSPKPFPHLNSRGPATKLRDVCQLEFETTDSKGYIVESVDAGVWKWWGFGGFGGYGMGALIATITFDVEPGKVNYIGHVGATYNEKGKVLGFKVADRFSLFDPIMRAGFGDAEIVNQAAHYAGFGDAKTEKEATDNCD